MKTIVVCVEIISDNGTVVRNNVESAITGMTWESMTSLGQDLPPDVVESRHRSWVLPGIWTQFAHDESPSVHSLRSCELVGRRCHQLHNCAGASLLGKRGEGPPRGAYASRLGRAYRQYRIWSLREGGVAGLEADCTVGSGGRLRFAERCISPPAAGRAHWGMLRNRIRISSLRESLQQLIPGVFFSALKPRKSYIQLTAEAALSEALS